MVTSTALRPAVAPPSPSSPRHEQLGHHHLSRPLEGSVALVTGGGRGIGRRVAMALAGAGADVGLVARSPHELAEVVDNIEQAGGTAAAATADVSEPAELAAAVEALGHRLGPIDLLVNNAGIIGPIGPLWGLDATRWWTAMEVNLRGVVLASHHVLPGMVERRAGRIINITSQAGAQRWPLVSAYSVSKAAVIKLTENLARETARYGIAVFSVHPGLLAIGMTEALAASSPGNRYEEHIRRWGLNELGAGRGADPGDAVDLIVRLAAGDGDTLSGRHLSVHDDLDTLVAHAQEVRDLDLYVLRPQRLP